ncbi:MAG: monooxygenase [Acidimicrobiaceae bacterium]|nr:monooxygenase [Acidimicrobiaceae bacterium]
MRMSEHLEEQLRNALLDADVRVLIPVLVHLTGRQDWLQEPFRPVRDTRLIADPSAGLSAEVQARIRSAALHELTRRPVQAAIERPDDELLRQMMSACLGESVPESYVPMMAQEMGFDDQDQATSDRRIDRSIDALIIGAGVSGICAAIALGAQDVTYTVLEANEDVGGTWFANRYPDCGVDTPNHFYSYSFAPNPDWARYFSKREEIHQYLRDCVEKFEVRPHIVFGERVVKATWSESDLLWHVETTRAGERRTYSARALIVAAGQLNRPAVPTIDGLDQFEGLEFHSAQWPSADQVELGGARVAVVGTGASAMQFVPRVAEQAERVTIFQRSPQWIRPIDQYHARVSDHVKWLMRHVPYYAAWFRFTLAWRYGDGLHRTLRRDPTWPFPGRSMNSTNERHRRELEEHFEQQLRERPDLLDKVVPSYPPYAKRMLVDNGWFETLKRSNVDLIVDPIARIRPDGIVTMLDDVFRVDTIIFATGFRATAILEDLEIVGRSRKSLTESWGANPRAYLGITVPDFPNLFLLYGPNTNLAHGGSIIFQAECQMRYVVSMLSEMTMAGADAVAVKEDVHDEYNRLVDREHEELVWSHPGVRSWYQNAEGRVVTNSPWTLVDYWHLTRQARLSDYHMTSSDSWRPA